MDGCVREQPIEINGRKKALGSEIQGKWESWTCRAIKSPSKLPLLAAGAILGSVCSAFNAQSAMEMIVFLLLLMLFHSREFLSKNAGLEYKDYLSFLC